MSIPAGVLNKMTSLYLQGFYLQAYEQSKLYGTPQTWTGTAAQVLAGRLVNQLGAFRLGTALHLKAWRQNPTDPQAINFYARAILNRQGILVAWEFLHQQDELPNASPEEQSDWWSLKAHVLGCLRDFERAETWMKRAEELAPDNPWLCIERSQLLERQDRYIESLEAAQQALIIHPWYPIGVGTVAHKLTLLNRDIEALDLLSEACQRLESAALIAQLAALQTELGLYAEARQNYDLYAERAPLLNKSGIQWLTNCQFKAAYYCRDFASAIELARQVETPFCKQFIEQVSQSIPEKTRSILPVRFVRQHHLTCAPATLTMISRYWNRTAEHLDIAEEICYDGTPSHRERYWAEQNGWVVKEFTVTWESAVALIDRGIPFTLATTEPGSAHLQAVIGYDRCLKLLILRDPYFRNQVEPWADDFLKHHQATGPRGMVLVPQDHVECLQDLRLPDTDRYDQIYQIQRSLVTHQREVAQTIYQHLLETDPDHRLTLNAACCLAIYDADQTSLLNSTEKLLKLFPDNANLQLSKLSCLKELSRRNERFILSKQLSEQKNSHPIFWQCFAQMLSEDTREAKTAIQLLRQAIRYSPDDAWNYYTLANILWSVRQFQEAFELYRFAACLKDTSQLCAQAFFHAAQYFKQSDSALEFLHQHWQRFNKQSSQPAQTLAWAYCQLNQISEAFKILELAQQTHPNDQDLLLARIETYAYYGNVKQAAILLNEAEGKVSRSAWLRTTANLSHLQGELLTGLERWQQVLQVEPLAIDANQTVALLLAETQGRTATLEFLQRVCNSFPHSYALHMLWSQWVADDEPIVEEQVLERLVAINPVDAQTRRKRSANLRRQRQFNQAFTEIELARQLDPYSPDYYCEYAALCEAQGNINTAKNAYKEALRLSVDVSWAASQLLLLCESRTEKREALDFIYQELVQQVTFGDGLLAFQTQAQSILEPNELLTRLKTGWQERPDLWHAWSAMVQQLIAMQQLDEALALARQSAKRFPLLPRVWFDLAMVERSRKNYEEQISSLKQALQLSPNWGIAVRALSGVYDQSGDLEQARQLLESAIKRSPLDSYHYASLAELLWRLEEKDLALSHLQKAIQLNPEYFWAWTTIRQWSAALNRPQLAVELARDLTLQRAGETRSWIVLAEMLSKEELPERLAVLDRAIALNSRCVEAYDLKASLLAEAKRYDEALATCQPAEWSDQRPYTLRARAIQIEKHRGNLEQYEIGLHGLIADTPEKNWAWEELTEHYYDSGKIDNFLKIAHQWTRTTPEEACAWGNLGLANLQNGDRVAAEAAYAKALELKPDYSFAAINLLDLYLTDNDLDKAEQVFMTVQSSIKTEDIILVKQLELAAKRCNFSAAQASLGKLSFSKTATNWHFEEILAAIHQADWIAQVEPVFYQCLKLPDVNPQVGGVWVKCCAFLNQWEKCEQTFYELDNNIELKRVAVSTYLYLIAENSESQYLQHYIMKNRNWLRQDSYLWGCAANALLTRSDYTTVLSWMDNWRTYVDIEPWMLSNLVEALRAQEREQEAHSISMHALTLPNDHSVYVHHLWLAFDAASQKKSEEALQLLQAVNLAADERYYQCLQYLINAMLKAQDKALLASDRLAQAKQYLKQAKSIQPSLSIRPSFWNLKPLSRAYKKVLWQIFKETKSPTILFNIIEVISTIWFAVGFGILLCTAMLIFLFDKPVLLYSSFLALANSSLVVLFWFGLSYLFRQGSRN